MRLSQLGWDSDFESYFQSLKSIGQNAARVCEENRGLYRVLSEQGEFLAQISGRIRFHAGERLDLPAVGDWVVIRKEQEQDKAIIESILPRKSILARKTIGRVMEVQIVATNLDVIFVVTSLNRDLNLRRLERYLSIAWESGAQPVIVLNKVDLCADPAASVSMVQDVAMHVPVHALSAITGSGMQQIKDYLAEGRTAALIGSSGVGKSTIINALTGSAAQHTVAIRESDDRGRHATSTRQLIVLPEGSILIDTPGMREIQLWENLSGLLQTFEDVEGLAVLCRFRNCAHKSEPGCAVREAIEVGALSRDRLESFQKLQSELKFQQSKTDIREKLTAKALAKRMCREHKRLYKSRNVDR